MIKHLFIAVIGFLSAFSLTAQNYGNEWINFSQQYFRISIPKTGLYRIDSTLIINSGIPLNTIKPQNLQLFIKGVEQHIYIKGDNDSVFNASDYLEFYAEKNDGQTDSVAYDNILRLPNPYVAMFNDTNYAYLTWNGLVNNKRMTVETDVNFTGYTAADYFYTEKVMVGRNTYGTGEILPPGIYDPRYITAEGFGDGILKGNNIQSNFSSTNIYPSTTLPAYIKIGYSGNSFDQIPGTTYDHQVRVEYYNAGNNYITLHDTFFSGYQHILLNKQITANQLQSSSTLRVSSINNPIFGSYSTQVVLNYVYLKYPQIPDLAGASEQSFWVHDNSSALKQFLNIQGVNTGTNSAILYDLTFHKYITVNTIGTNVKALVPNMGVPKKCFLTTTGNINYVTAITPIGQAGYFTNYKQSNPDSAYLIVTHKSLQSSANNYKLYRQSISGGSNNVILAYVEDLYDQFAYGNVKNPLAIKNFCRFLSDSLNTPPKYLLLLGKSIKNEDVRANAFNWNNCLVPTMGRPASDNLLTAGIHGINNSTPFIPTGRVSAKTNTQVIDYLNKVITHESATYGINKPVPDDWRKHVLHFAGGTDAAQQGLFQFYLQTYSITITDTAYGGKVFNFAKTTTAPIQITISDSVKQLIDYGASIITFFGHGSTSGFDQAIDDPNAYNNKDKYPLFIANSCYSGDIHLPTTVSASENFTLIKDKGSIAFLASSSTGVINPLYYYSDFVYKSLATQTYYKSIGDAVKNACYLGSTAIIDFGLQKVTGLDMTLEGDPYIRLNAYAKPDYMINNSSVSLDATTLTDSIGIHVFIRNNGKAITDTFVVRVERYFPSGDSVTFFRKIKAPYNNTTLNFNILKDFDRGIGLNHFKVFIDSYNDIYELSETNNSTTGNVDLFISGGDITPVFPYKYAIIPKAPQVTLKASTADPFAPNYNYKIELDTNDTFLNPINSTIVNSNGGVVEWTVNLPYGDSTVYFWRVSKDSVTPADHYNWKESSFQTIIGKNGWGQAHFHQFKNDRYQFVKYKKAQRLFDFENDISSLSCRDGFYPNVNFDQITYSLNSSTMHIWSCAPGGWSIVVFDSISAQPRISQSSLQPVAGPGPYNNCHCDGTRNLYAFDFGNSNSCSFSGWQWQTDMYNLLNSLPVNTKILAYSQQNHASSTFSNNLYTEFEKFGSANIRTIADTVPIIIFGKKTSGTSIGSAHEVVGINKNSIITLDDSIRTNWNNGFVASEIIGPAAKWNSLHWQQVSLEMPNKDSVVLKVVGIRTNGQRDTLVTFPADSTDVLDLYSYANAATYPYMQLVARMKDDVYKTPAQLKRWQVLYDESPECALNSKKGFLVNDTIQEGQELIVQLPIENIGVLPFTDSLVVTYWFEDRQKITHPLPQKLKASPFVPGQLITDTIRVDTTGFTGINYLWVDVNPPGNSKYQKEQYHFNNIARIPFYVSADKINPLLDVTFDGNHILNGDIVSAKPHVLVTLKDENKFLALNDTANFAVYIRYPGQSTEKRLWFASSLRFTPAQLPSNSCKIEWMPELANDGKYKLIVQATDRSKNVSGAVDYNIEFEIVNKQTVTEVLNYPNPFSTATKFVFTLTGSEVPDVFIIQIMTITGKVVKEITKDELGNIHIGRNITSYTWDGKDEYGDKLGNGVYLYRVITRHNGQAIEKRETDADSFFKKGIGKLVIMR